MQVTVAAQDDFLEKLAGRGRPSTAIAELIWNGLDADAERVEVSVKRNLLDGIEWIRVSDDGVGFSAEDAKDAFANLGGSWKKRRETTPRDGRLLHGKDGKGRFRAFGLGAVVTWESYVADGADPAKGVLVEGSAEDLKHFEINEISGGTRGTVVTVAEVWDELRDLEDGRVAEELTEILALYLREYPDVSVVYLGAPLRPTLIEDRSEVIQLGPLEIDGQVIESVELEVVEWGRPTSRSIYLCDSAGFTLGRVPPNVSAPGFAFTAHLRTDFFRSIADSLEFGDTHPGLQVVLDAAREALREHFRARGADRVREQVVEWRASDIYPYQGEPADPVETAERQVFDVVAYNVASYLPSFAKSEKQTQQFSFRLLRQAIEENPASLRRILGDVLKLPTESQDELAELLERTSLAAIITAAKEVADRLDFLRGLEILLFSPETKKQLLERSELHRILARETWIFGEQFNLAVDDQSLTEVLNKHLGILRRESEETTAANLDDESLPDVLREDGKRGIVDLMLSRRIPQRREEEREHLVVELKRPSQAINPAVAQQVRSYAFAVHRDDRFNRTTTEWEFWAVSNRVTEQVEWEMQDKTQGILHQAEGIAVRIKTWGEILEECRARLTFFQQRLSYIPDDADGIAYLRSIYEQYLPKTLDGIGELDTL